MRWSWTTTSRALAWVVGLYGMVFVAVGMLALWLEVSWEEAGPADALLVAAVYIPLGTAAFAALGYARAGTRQATITFARAAATVLTAGFAVTVAYLWLGS